MASSDGVIGNGLTITFGTSAFTAQILSVKLPDTTRKEIDTTHMGTQGARTYRPAALVDHGDLELDVNYNPDHIPPVAGAIELVTVTLPEGAQFLANAFVTKWTPGTLNEDKATAKISLKPSGYITGVAAGAAVSAGVTF